jgi:RNA polymerase sigma-32 factor
MNAFPYEHDDHLGSFLSKARKFPMLTAEEEPELVNRWRKEADQSALTLLLGSHLRLVIKMAFGYRGYGLSIADLIAEGNLGLMQAVERFDVARGFRFATYAQWWIRAAIQEHILRNWSLVRMGTTAAQKKLFFNLRRLKGTLDAYDEGDLSPAVVSSIAAALGVAETDVVEMNRRLAGNESSLNASVGEDGETSYQDLLPDDSVDQETAYAQSEELCKRRALFEDAFAALTPRERQILTERKLVESPKTLAELGVIHGVSRERIRQIEESAFGKLKKAVLGKSARDLFNEPAQTNDELLVAA